MRASVTVYPELQSVRARRQLVVGWLAVVALLLVQWLLLVQYARREIVWAYPPHYDQVQYLTQSYETYERIRAEGLLPGLRAGLGIRPPQGMMIHLQAGGLFLLLGPGRLSALVLNFFYFMLLQFVLVAVLRWLTARWDIALIGLGLLLAASSPFYWAGGLMDFRIDFIASCLFGVVICLVIRSRMFASWRWSLVVGAAASLLVLFRFLTLTYLIGIFGVFGLFLCFLLWRTRHAPAARQAALARLAGLTLAGVVMLVVTLPALWYHREQLWVYYGIGHALGAEKEVRARELNITDLSGALLHYPRSVVLYHAGPLFLLFGALVLALAALFFRSRPLPRRWALPRGLHTPTVLCFLAICLVAPYTILTLNSAKSPVVGNMFIHPMLWLIMIALIIGVESSAPATGRPAWGRAITVLAVLGMVLGASNQVFRLNQPSDLSRNRANTEQIVRLHELLFQQSRQRGWERPLISVNKITDYVNAGVIRVVIYERHGVMFRSQSGFGSSIMLEDEKQIAEVLTKSDVVILTPPLPNDRLVYPFDIRMREMYPSLAAYCEQHLERLETLRISGREYAVYVRRAPAG